MINQEYDALITEWIENNYSRVIDNWMELIRIPSVKSDAAENAPFGVNCSKALNRAANYFAGEGISSKVYNDGGYALATYGNGKSTIGLFCHSDVVPVGDDWLFTKPFEPIIKDGSLIGRGAEDNKSGIIAGLCLMEFLRDYNIPISSTITTFIGSDEECGMQDLEVFLEEHKMPDISIVPDADFPCSVGEKGIYHLWVQSNKQLESVLSFTGGEAFNIVLDKAEVKLKYCEKLYSQLKIKTADKNRFELTVEDNAITLSAKGVAKHASIPEGSINAAALLCELLIECDSLSENDREILSAASRLLSDYYGAGFNCEHEDENFGKLTCVNGMVKVEEGKLCLSFDIRYGDTLDADVLIEKTNLATENVGFDIIYSNNTPGFFIDKNSKVPSVLEDVFFEITGDKLERVLMSGGTYARKLKNAFSVGTFYITKDRKTPVLEMPDGHGGPHQCDERIDIEGFFDALRILIHYVLACDKLLNS